MTESSLSFRMIGLHLATVMIFSSLQTTLWYQVLGQIPAPQLWLSWLIFLALYRPYFEALFVSYVFGLIMTAFSSSPLSLVWPTFLILVSTVSFARNKVFWPGLRYFMIATLIASISWHVVVFSLSHFIEKTPAPPMFIFRLLEVLMTFLSSPLVYIVMKKLESFRPSDVTRSSLAGDTL
jgi:hypothetical protein